MRNLLILVSLIFISQANAGKFSDSTMANVYKHIVADKCDSAISDFLNAGPLLKEKLNSKPQIDQMAMQLKMLLSGAGKVVQYERIGSDKLGKLERTKYLLYTEGAVLKIELIEYLINGQTTLVNFRFDDEIGRWFY